MNQHKRKEFTPKTKRLEKEHAQSICRRCGSRTDTGEFNHAHASWSGGGNDLGNCEYLCVDCHGKQSRRDRAEAAKAKRRSGETPSQFAGNKKRRGRAIPSRPFPKQQRPLRSRGFQKARDR